jgi:hypothetical protein
MSIIFILSILLFLFHSRNNHVFLQDCIFDVSIVNYLDLIKRIYYYELVRKIIRLMLDKKTNCLFSFIFFPMLYIEIIIVTTNHVNAHVYD